MGDFCLKKIEKTNASGIFPIETETTIVAALVRCSATNNTVVRRVRPW